MFQMKAAGNSHVTGQCLRAFRREPDQPLTLVCCSLGLQYFHAERVKGDTVRWCLLTTLPHPLNCGRDVGRCADHGAAVFVVHL